MHLVNEVSKPIIVKDSSSFLYNCIVAHPNFKKKNFGSYESLLFGNYIPRKSDGKKKDFDKVGKFSEFLKVEDWDMWLQISVEYAIGYIDERHAIA